jgi:uncharacterized protein
MHIEQLVEILLDAGFDVNAILPNNQLLLVWLITSRKAYSPNLVREFLNRPDFDVSKRDVRGFTYLIHFATCAADDEDLWSPDVMDRFCGDINEKVHGVSALDVACKHGAAAVKYLLEHGADPNIVTEGNRGVFSMVVANKIDGDKALRLLLKHNLDLSVGFRDFPSALHHAAAYRHVTIVQVLLDYGADKDSVDPTGRFAFHYAISGLSEPKHGADLSLRLLEMLLPSKLPVESLMWVRSCFSQDLIRQMVERGADPCHVDLSRGASVTHMAVKFNLSVDCLKLLLELGAAKHINDQPAAALPPLFMAVATANARTAVIQTLLDFGADIHAKSSAGRTVLSHLILSSSKSAAEVLEYLLNAGADPTIPVVYHKKPTTLGRLCIKQDRLDCLKCLAQYGYNLVDDVDAKGRTLLHIACDWDIEGDIIRFLIEQGVPINVRNNDGKTPLIHLAGLRCDDCRILDLLVSLGADPTLLPDGYSSLLEFCVKHSSEPAIKWCIGLESTKQLGFSAEDVPEDGDVLKFVLTDPRFQSWLRDPCKIPSRMKSSVLDALLLRAADKGDATRFELILTHGGSLQARTDAGNTPLLIACTCQKVDVSFLELLVDKYGYSVHDRDAVTGGSLLHRAECKSTADFLISRGVDESIKDKDGKLWHEVVEWKAAEEPADAQS